MASIAFSWESGVSSSLRSQVSSDYGGFANSEVKTSVYLVNRAALIDHYTEICVVLIMFVW